MEVVVRCSGLLPLPMPISFSRRTLPSDQVSGEINLPRKVASLPLKATEFISSFGNVFIKPFNSNVALLSNQPMHLELDERICNIGSMQSDQHTFLEYTPDQAMVFVRSTSMGILVCNALMLTAPLEAMAETCEANSSIFNMPLLLMVALVGATVGGLLARQRKGELQRLNEQLRQINAALRKQAKIESYAPALSYAPVGSKIVESEVIVDPKKHELMSHLKNGKNFLRNQDLEKAFLEFKMALELAQTLKDPVEEKKAARGLGASLQRQVKYREAIKYHSMVLAISDREGEDSGNTEAYGAIADCYTELGDLERAAAYYDQYIARLESD